MIQFLLNMRFLSHIIFILGCRWYDQQRPSHFEYWWSSPSTCRPWSWCERLDKTLMYQLVCCSFLIQINSDVVFYIWTDSSITSHAIKFWTQYSTVLRSFLPKSQGKKAIIRKFAINSFVENSCVWRNSGIIRCKRSNNYCHIFHVVSHCTLDLNLHFFLIRRLVHDMFLSSTFQIMFLSRDRNTYALDKSWT